MKVYSDLDIAIIERYASTLSKGESEYLLNKVETDCGIQKEEAKFRVSNLFDMLETKDLSGFCWIGKILYPGFEVVKYRRFQRDLGRYSDSFQRDQGGVFVFNGKKMEIYPTGEYINMIMEGKKLSWRNKYYCSGESIQLFAHLISHCVIHKSV